MTDNLPEFLADLDQNVEIFRHRARMARSNITERNRLILSLRKTISQIRFAKTKFPDDGDQILLETAEEDCLQILHSLGIIENIYPTMRDLMDKIAI